MDVELALKINKIIHDECKDVPHDIGLRITELIEKHQAKQLILSGVSDCNMQDFMLHYQNSKHIFTDKAIDVIKTYKR